MPTAAFMLQCQSWVLVTAYGLQNLKYLPFSPLLKKFPASWSRERRPDVYTWQLRSLLVCVVVHLLSHVLLFVILWTAAAILPSFTISWSLLKLMSIKLVLPSNLLVLCHSVLLLPSIFSSFRVFSNESPLHIKRAKHWSFSFSISPSNEYSGLISFRMDWFDLLTVERTLKSLLQHHSLKA